MDRKYARAACWGKEAFRTYSEAAAVATRAIKQTRMSIVPYRCRECHLWHIGNWGKGSPDTRVNSKEWKNWNWRKENE